MYRLLILLAAFVVATPSYGQLLHDIVEAEVPLGDVTAETIGKRTELTRAADRIGVPYTGVAAEIGSDADELTAWVRFREDDASWSPWYSMHVTRSPMGGTFLVGYHQEAVLPDGGYEIRISAPETSITSIRESGVFDTRLDTDGQQPEGLIALRGKSNGHIIPPPLITRAEWGAAPFKGGSPSPLSNGSYNYMTFHHAAGWSSTTLSEGLAAVKSIQDFHQNGRGWSDIGYQFLIDRGGRLYQGRPFLDGSTSLEQVPALALGAHVGGANTANIGISILGCYHPPEGSNCTEVITPEAYQTYVTLFAFLSERYGVSPSFIRGHRDFSTTACPGDNNYELLPDIRIDVAELLESGNLPVGAAELTASMDEAGVIHVSWEITENSDIESIVLERVTDNTTLVLYTGPAASGSWADATLPSGQSASYRIYAVTSDGRQQRLATVETTLSGPSEYVLSDVFPNPAAESATLRYFVPSDGFVRINLYDSSGRVVRTLRDQFVDGGAWHSSLLDISNLSSGTYFYRMMVEGFSGIVFDESRTLVVQ